MRFAGSSSLVLVAAMALSLSGCGLRPDVVASAPPPPELPPLPVYFAACFAGTAWLPADTEWSAEQVTQVIARLRQSEARRTRCGLLLIQFYEDLARVLRSGSS